MVCALLEEKLSLIQASNNIKKEGDAITSGITDKDIATMLDNIDLF